MDQEKTYNELLDEAYYIRTESEDGQTNMAEDMEQRIASVMTALSPYRPEEKSRRVIEEFLTFHIQTAAMKKQESRLTLYNLLLLCEDTDTALEATSILAEALSIDSSAVFSTTEAAAIERFPTPPIPANARLVLIYDCHDAPRLNLDGGAALRDSSRKAIAAYNHMWKTVASYVRRHPKTILLVSSNHSVYRSSLRPNTDISRRLCAGHVHLHALSAEMLLEQCLAEFQISSFTVTEEFEAALRNYFPAAYRVSDLRSREFIKEVVSRIYARFFSRKREAAVLTADCVPDDNPKFQSAETILGNMNELVGLRTVKEEFANIYKMQLAGLAEKDARYHMIFTGNPGTGKTTVAQMAADLLYSMNLIKRNKLVVAKPSDMISEWIGGTGTKAMEVIRRAYNGVLFIDEAYGIATIDRGDDLLNILLQEMENNSDKLVVIFAGYTDEMRDLLKANPGLSSRVGRQIQFDDYTLEELADIFHIMAEKEGFTLHPDARDELEDCIAALMTKEFFGNAREIRNMLQDLKEAWSEDYYKAVTGGQEEASLPREFLPRHFDKIRPPKKEVSIHDLVGLDVMKHKLEDFKRQAMYQKHLKEKGFTGLGDFSMHMIFTGNPGTGKTTVAKLIADDLYAIGMLKTNRLVVAERKDLITPYGNTAAKTADIIRKAVGGVLFIDEAYSLADNRRGGHGNECIEVLLTAMEEHKSDTVFIFAGYVNEMQDFLSMNPGISSRIGYTFHFEDYSPEELTQMYDRKMRKTGFSVTEGALQRVHAIMEYFQDVEHFGNGRFVDHVIHQTISQRANRDFSKNYRSIQARDIPSMKTLIETAPNTMQLYDPATVTEAQQRKTAIHELGHAVVMLACDPENLPKKLSIHSHAGSYGRVTINTGHGNLTEQQLMDLLAAILGGKNAERLIYGTHDTGCCSDYNRAKHIAADMVEKFAMTTFGKTAEEILDAADKRSTELLTQYRDKLEPLATLLQKRKEISGKEFSKILKAQKLP